MNEVVISGIGIISSLGSNIDDFWNNIIKGKSGIKIIEKFDTKDLSCKIGAEINNFDPSLYISSKEERIFDLYIQYALAASKLALIDGFLNTKLFDPNRIGVFVSTGIGGIETLEKQSFNLFSYGVKKISPFMIPSLISNMASGAIAIDIGAKGPNYCITSACASSSHSLGEAFKVIQSNKADIMICGGSEAAITKLGYAGFCNLRAMSTKFNDNPKIASRPFDQKRDGFVMGEGSAVLILENKKHAEKRKAKIYCEIIGYGLSCDAYHITKPDPTGSGLKNCFDIALKDAQINKNSVDYINAHGTSTIYNDKFETLAIKSFFGEYSSKINISSTKSMTGHLLGASGALEAAVCAKSLSTSIIPPTINYEYKDNDCDLNYTPNFSIKKNINIALSNNLGFGGQNSTLIFKKYIK